MAAAAEFFGRLRPSSSWALVGACAVAVLCLGVRSCGSSSIDLRIRGAHAIPLAQRTEGHSSVLVTVNAALPESAEETVLLDDTPFVGPAAHRRLLPARHGWRFDDSKPRRSSCALFRWGSGTDPPVIPA